MNEQIIKIELEDELDLHHFHPKDAKALLHEFIEMSYKKGKREIRIAHGKGKSVLKRIVISELEKNDRIASFGNDSANWGATIAQLKQKEK